MKGNHTFFKEAGMASALLYQAWGVRYYHFHKTTTARSADPKL